MGEGESEDEPVEWPINGELDLHLFRPQDVKDVVEEYLSACQRKGILEVRIVHGKGIGNLMRTVHSILSQHPEVIDYGLASGYFGGAGATIVSLRPPVDSSS